MRSLGGCLVLSLNSILRYGSAPSSQSSACSLKSGLFAKYVNCDAFFTRRWYAWRRNRTEKRMPGSQKTPLFLRCDVWTKKVIDVIVNDMQQCSTSDLYRMADIWLPNPGDSSLVTMLLNRFPGSSFVAWESSKLYANHLEGLSSRVGPRFQFRTTSFSQDFSRLDELLDKTGTDIIFVGHLDNPSSYISRLLFNLSLDERSFWKPGRVVHYIFVSEKEYQLMSESQQLWSTSRSFRPALYNLFFNTKDLLEIPMDAFKRSTTRGQISAVDEKLIDSDRYNKEVQEHIETTVQAVMDASRLETTNKASWTESDMPEQAPPVMYLVKMIVRSDVFNEMCPSPTCVQNFVQLVKTVGRKKGQRVIPTVERWCPDIGLSLIDCGVGMLDRFKELPISMLPVIYKLLISSPHYNYSTMKLVLDNDRSGVRQQRGWKQRTGEDLDSIDDNADDDDDNDSGNDSDDDDDYDGDGVNSTTAIDSIKSDRRD